MFLHFAGTEGLSRITQDTKASDQALLNQLKDWREHQRTEIRRAKKRLARVRANNERIQRRNELDPAAVPIALLDEPSIPRLTHGNNVVLDEIAASLPGVVPEKLPLATLISRLSKLAGEVGFGTEQFDPVYHVYRIVSAVGPHPTLHLWGSYLEHSREDTHFDRTLKHVHTGDSGNNSLHNAVYSTAMLASHVVGDRGGTVDVAQALWTSYEPDFDDPRGWTPGRHQP